MAKTREQNVKQCWNIY